MCGKWVIFILCPTSSTFPSNEARMVMASEFCYMYTELSVQSQDGELTSNKKSQPSLLRGTVKLGLYKQRN